MKQVLTIIVVALVALTAGIWARGGSNFHLPSKQKPIAFKLPDLDGRLRDSSEWKGKILIINFWATWCPPCKKEIPTFIALQERLSPKGVQFIGIAIDDKPAVIDFVSSLKVNYPILMGDNQGAALARKFGNLSDSVPFTVIVNREGKIIHRQHGELSEKEMLESISALLPEPIVHQ